MPLLVIILEPILTPASHQLLTRLLHHINSPVFASALTRKTARAVGEIAPEAIYNARQFISIPELLETFPAQPTLFISQGKVLNTKASQLP